MAPVDLQVLHVPSASAARCNVSAPERWITGVAGAAAAAFGLMKGGKTGGWLALAGGGLIAGAVTGYCPVYALLGREGDMAWPPNPATETTRALSGSRGVRVHTGVTIDRPLAEVYAFFRDLENLPRFMTHLASVRTIDERQSHWVVRAPAGGTVEWDAEIIHEEPNKVIGWRSIGDADVVNAGSVNFDRAPGDRGTEVRVSLQYQPPAGKLGAAVAALFGEEPSRQVREDLRRLKELLEAGEVPTTQGQTTGRR
jgi:uncharacterized membrane protein